MSEDVRAAIAGRLNADLKLHQPADGGRWDDETLCVVCSDPYPCPASLVLDDAALRLASRRGHTNAVNSKDDHRQS